MSLNDTAPPVLFAIITTGIKTWIHNENPPSFPQTTSDELERMVSTSAIEQA